MSTITKYYFSKARSGYRSTHSLIRELFDAPINACHALAKGDLVIVASSSIPAKKVHYNTEQIQPISTDARKIRIETHVAFDNRHRGNTGVPKLNPNECLERVLALTGLNRTDKSKCFFIGPHREGKFNIKNTFKVCGEFIVTDHNKLNECLLGGIGSRRSYGYGLIQVEVVKT